MAGLKRNSAEENVRELRRADVPARSLRRSDPERDQCAGMFQR